MKLFHYPPITRINQLRLLTLLNTAKTAIPTIIKMAICKPPDSKVTTAAIIPNLMKNNPKMMSAKNFQNMFFLLIYVNAPRLAP